MKTKLRNIFLSVLALGFASCGTGTNLNFGPDGVVITPPVAPIVVPTTPLVAPVATVVPAN